MSEATAPLSCLIVAADAFLAQQAEGFLATTPLLQCVGSYASLPAAQLQHKQHPAILVLDDAALLDHPDFSTSAWPEPPIVILLAQATDIVPALPWPVADAVEKPLNFPRFLKATQRAVELCRPPAFQSLPTPNNNDFIIIKQGKQLIEVVFDEVRYVEALSDYVHIITGQSKLLVHGTMRAMEQRFPSPPFLRVHRSFIINTKWVQAMEGNSLTITHKQIPIGSTYLKRVKHELGA
ncbi:LytTR family DNA-binding domain-containing protein [Hymenobacter sp. BT730]|uniref:LytR/AlgR family response regulator transcription factor n=1 Tax=Hymenobacter sp. BT730 TaxID=3063332 RepID=UPI0026DFDCA5|nr:LytTR family DNA-binding domain-containing protein [Hymenobacter sp. BT730]